MNSKKPRVALIFGGRGFEHEVSVAGAKYLYPKIDGTLYEKIPIFISKWGEWLMPTSPEATVEALSLGRCETACAAPAARCGKGGLVTDSGFIPLGAALPLLHGDFGEDGVIAGALENAKIPYVGCDSATSAVLSDKAFTKLAAEKLGIPTVPWLYSVNESCEGAQERAESTLPYPIFIKPARLGSSVGAGAVFGRGDFSEAFEKAFTLGSGRVIIEKLVSVKKELECAYFSSKSKELFTSVGEISCQSGFYDYESKYKEGSSALVLDGARISAQTALLIRDYSRRLVRYFGVRDLARIDFFLSEDGEIFFNEINTIPGFTAGSLYPRLLSRSGVSAVEAVNIFLESALSRGT